MITRAQPDPQRAQALRATAATTLVRLTETRQEAFPANTLIDYYDTLHQLMEAILCDLGRRARGNGAHKELIDFLALHGVFDEGTRIFLQELRERRNRMQYDGTAIPWEYVANKRERILKIIKELSW